MATQDYVLKTFIVYIFIKALIFMPLAWMAFVVWWNERSEKSLAPELLAAAE
jgi:hypothetical protein